MAMSSAALSHSKRSGIMLGVGLGGFVDGILLHQILHWHNMGSAVVPPTTLDAIERNMRWDGFFHVGTLLLTVVGVYWLLLDARQNRPLPSPKAFTGLLVLGWGMFNLVEGLIDHVILGIHHVRDLPAHVPAYDWVFLAFGGIGFMLLGWLVQAGRRDPWFRSG